MDEAELRFLEAYELGDDFPHENGEARDAWEAFLRRIRLGLQQVQDCNNTGDGAKGRAYTWPTDVPGRIEELEVIVAGGGGFYPFDVGCPLSKDTVHKVPDTHWMPEPNSNGFVAFRTDEVYSQKLQGHGRCLEEALTFAWGGGLAKKGVGASAMMNAVVALVQDSNMGSWEVEGTIACSNRMLEALPRCTTGHHFSFQRVPHIQEHGWLPLIVPIPYMLLVCCPVQWWDDGTPQVTTHWCVLDTARLLLFVAPKPRCLPEAKREWVQGCVQIELKDFTKHGASFAEYILEKYKLTPPTVACKLMVNVHHVHDHDTGFVFSRDALDNCEHIKRRREKKNARNQR